MQGERGTPIPTLDVTLPLEQSLGLKSQVPHLRGMLLQQIRNSCRPGGKALASSAQQL